MSKVTKAIYLVKRKISFYKILTKMIGKDLLGGNGLASAKA
jgi:hypothetical protein